MPAPQRPIPSTGFFQLPSTLESVSEIERSAEAMARHLGLDEDTASNVAMVTREAAINACKHGNRFAGDKQVHATLDRTAETLTICIADQGEGTQPTGTAGPLRPCKSAAKLRAWCFPDAGHHG